MTDYSAVAISTEPAQGSDQPTTSPACRSRSFSPVC